MKYIYYYIFYMYMYQIYIYYKVIDLVEYNIVKQQIKKLKNVKMCRANKEIMQKSKICIFFIIIFILCFFVAVLLVSKVILHLPMFHLTFFPTVINSVTSFAWSKFVLWWIVWSVAGCTFKGLWYERGCCSSFFFVQDLEISDGTLVSLLC